MDDERYQREEHAQEGLALGNPGHRFDLQGVEAEQNPSQEDRHGIEGEHLQQDHHQGGIGQVQGLVVEMVGARREAEEADVGRVREPCQAGANWPP